MIQTIKGIAWDSDIAEIKGVLDERIEALCDERLLAGQKHYANSWCEVDLKEDFQEEILDAINYARFMEARARLTGVNLETGAANVIGTLLGLYDYVSRFPDFAGPTSNQWVKNKQAQDDV